MHIQALQEFYLYIQVPFGVQLKNKNFIEEMVEIMSHIQEYVPTISSMVEMKMEIGEQETLLVLQSM